VQIRIILATLIALFLGSSVRAQQTDTLKLTQQQADSLFLVNNYQLLAARYQVKSDSAMIFQARLWDNPSFSAELGMNSWNHPKISIGREGQTAFSIDQLIQLAGKRRANIQLTALQANYSEAGFEDLMRTLKWELHNAFSDYFFKYSTIQVLREQQDVLDRIVAAYKRADSSGSVAHADYLRLAQLQMSLKNDYLSALGDLNDLQCRLQQVLGTTSPVLPVMVGFQRTDKFSLNYTLDQLIQTALSRRADVKMGRLDQQSTAVNYRLQKSLAVPDLHLGAIYDKNSGVVHNYMGMTLGIDLPLWNRNQGRIRSAGLKVEQGEFKSLQMKNLVKTEVSNAYNKFNTYREAFNPEALSSFHVSFSHLIGQVAANFTKGNITLLQFIDFFNSYSDNLTDQSGYYSALYSAFNDLEYAVGISLMQN